jgi:adenosine deaminase
MCFLRDLTVESAMETLEQSLPYGDWIVGVGLDSDEKGNPPVKFEEVFDRARREGYRLTMHCDVDQENSVASTSGNASTRSGWKEWITVSTRLRTRR